MQLSKGARDSGSAERSANSDIIVSDQRRERCRVGCVGVPLALRVSRACTQSGTSVVVDSFSLSFVLFMRARVLSSRSLWT